MTGVRCNATHPVVGLPCVRTDVHTRHRAERPRSTPTYRATDCWVWGPREPHPADRLTDPPP